MKGSCSGEEIEIKNKYVFFSDPETISERAEKSRAILRNQQVTQLRKQEQECTSQRVLGNIIGGSTNHNKKYAESFGLHQPVQSHPFTFITAVKRKLALAAYNETTKRPYNGFFEKPADAMNIDSNDIDSTSRESLYEVVKKMDFIKPLKVPDVKISPKTLDYATKESINLREYSGLKVSTTSSSQKNEKVSKGMERVHRKLDFSVSDGHSLVSSDDVEPLRAPDLMISPSLTKQKDHGRDSCREKENRIKRMKKDDGVASKMDAVSPELSKRGKSPKHLSRKDATESKRAKAERGSLLTSLREPEITSKKPKSKNFATSTLKKEEDKRIRSGSGGHAAKSIRDRSLESRGRTFSNESPTDRCSKAHEKITARDQSRLIMDTDVLKYNDDYQILHALRQIEEKQKTGLDAKPPKIVGRSSSSSSQSVQQKSTEQPAKEQQQQHKRLQERSTKASTSKSQIRGTSSASEMTEEMEAFSDCNKSRNASESQQNLKISSHNSNESDEMIFDPAKISFRDDSYSQQDEFCDLVTPDMNLTLRSKRRKQQMSSEVETDNEDKTGKNSRTRNPEVDSQSLESSFVHPTALHMQFQAELHLFDSYNESLRQMEGVEKCLYNVKNDRSKELLMKQRLVNDEMRKQLNAMQAERDSEEPLASTTSGGEISRVRERENDTETSEDAKFLPRETEVDSRKSRQEMELRDCKPDVRVAETQTANDIATQTESRSNRHAAIERTKQYPGITYERGDFLKSDIPELSLGSLEQFDDLDNLEDISIPGKMRTMSEISLHETTSSIKTETGTEISISTRDVTCSFNKYLDHEMAQLIKDEKLMYDKIEMLFKSREKTLNDRTKKLVKLEEQKRALRDTGQDSRISSVKKKQRALLLKLQQEKDEMNRLKELHKIASQERKLMLQKQRNMFNPQMSTKNILTKLKRSADCQSPRRLSGPMKGYDIRSNSSMSSLLESEKAQIDRARLDIKNLLPDSSYRIDENTVKSDLENSAPEKHDVSSRMRYLKSTSLNDLEQFNEFGGNFVISPQKLESKARKFEEKMPNSRTSLLMRHLLNPGQIIESQEETREQVSSKNIESNENAKSESDTLVEELSKKSKSLVNENSQITGQSKESVNHDVQHETNFSNLRRSKGLQVNEDSLHQAYRCSKKNDNALIIERDGSKKIQQQHQQEAKAMGKRKSGKSLKTKSTSSILSENILRTKENVNDEAIKPANNNNNKRTKMEKELMADRYPSSTLEEIDLNESENSLQALVRHSKAVKDKSYKLLHDVASEQRETKENIESGNLMDRSSDNRDNDSRKEDPDLQNLGNISTRSQVSTFTISRHSSGDSEKSFSRSVVIRAQDHPFKTSKKLEEALNAREAALVARRNCVEDWIAWHTKLKAEECRVARMEQAAFKLVSTAANALSYHDTTVSSDTSDVEGRVELLAEKLAERRMEMARLRRETRKQAKRRLKALELNLLNQIKKYDTTINEMQRKLETQKGVMKESDKLAIESRSVADFKVPEIPLKRIQELYKSNDLLRSRSDSDLIFSKSLRSGSSENCCVTDNPDEESVHQASSLRDGKSSRTSKISSTREPRTNQSAESVLEEAKKFTSGNTEKIFDASSDRESQVTSVSRSQESVGSEDVSNYRRSTVSVVDDAEPIIDDAKITGPTVVESSEISEAISEPETEGNSKLFSRKLESLQLTNKNLNDDISTLENDLKALSEMMSQFSKKSDDKLNAQPTAEALEEPDEIITVVDSSPRNTSRDITEELLESVHTEIDDKVFSVEERLDIAGSSHSNDFIPETSNVEEILETPRISEDPNSQRVSSTDAIKTIVSSEDSGITKPNEEMDFEARSKEILSVIEKSIISERVDSSDKESVMSDVSIEKSIIDDNLENEELSQNLDSLGNDAKSISEIISEITENKENFEIVVETLRKDSSSIASPKNEKKQTERNSEREEKLEAESMENIETVILSDSLSTNSDKSQQKISSTLSKIEDVKIDKIDEFGSKSPDEEITPRKEEEDECESIEEELTLSQHENDNSYDNDSMISKKSSEISCDDEEEKEKIEREADGTNNSRTIESSLQNLVDENNEEYMENDKISHGQISMENDWTISDSFEIPEKANEIPNECEKSYQLEASISIVPSEMSALNFSEEESQESRIDDGRRETENFTCDMNDVSSFIPRGESTTIGYRFEDSLNKEEEKNDSNQVDELDDILDIIARDSEENREESPRVPRVIVTSDDPIETDYSQPETKAASNNRIIPLPTDLNLTSEVEPVLQKLTEILQGVERNIALRRKKGNEELVERKDSIFAQDHPTSSDIVASKSLSNEIETLPQKNSQPEILESENVAENLDDKIVVNKPDEIFETPKTVSEDDGKSRIVDSVEENPVIEEKASHSIAKLAEKTFDILRDPEYEDISEESLEVSEILDRTESQASTINSSKSKRIPDKYEMKQKSDDVLRILDEISQKSYSRSDSKEDQHIHDVQISVQVFGSVSPGFTNKGIASEELRGQIIGTVKDDVKSVEIEIVSLKDNKNEEEEEKYFVEEEKEKHFIEAAEARDQALEKQDNYESSESSEGADTPRGVSEIEMDSPRDPNESRLDIDALDDDLLSIGEAAKELNDAKAEFPVGTSVVSSEKDIETMIDKLKASLEQPGLEVAELEAKLLRIEQLQIELEIKKLEAEEVSYYMREIPNKPPPPYTPPGGVRLTTPQVSPTLAPAVVPSNVEELTAFTEKATILIFNAKNSGLDITNLQPPPEIFQLNRDNDEVSKHDRRIYNTFLFDLCKETIAELYRSEYEKPGPSWTKPNVKTKPAMKIPKTIEELNDYVSKEVATLFGFKTKLQRENMVMRWSRKRRDRVDELLAREAQAEEDEWTKFHHDELAVKNELTVAILDTLLLETTNCVKAVYAKKRKVIVA